MLLALAIAGLFFLPDPWRVILLVGAAFVEIGEVYFWIKFLRRYRVTTGAEGMLGETGEAISPCDPFGRVRVRGEIWNARCDAGLEAGERAVVKAVEGLTLVVERP
ncbi:MAG TPA: NfeD family protein [Solirubrobacterales bacterium]|nr:NfeD family protein [Solirubrobacterales bacterium]